MHEPMTPRLSGTQLRLLRLLSLGLTVQESALRLGVSEHTAAFHIRSTMDALGFTSVDQLLQHARLLSASVK
jgi:DNA-binding CsgD family transcriptional regulator